MWPRVVQSLLPSPSLPSRVHHNTEPSTTPSTAPNSNTKPTSLQHFNTFKKITASNKNQPAAMAGSICHIAASVLLLAASILLLVASISAPVVNHIGILVVKLPEDAKGDEITFGTFGYCIEHGGDK